MPSSSINIGINQLGKNLVEKIDLHFRNHETDFHKNYVLSASIETQKVNQHLSVIKEGEYSISNCENIKTWFDSELYGEIKRLRNLVIGLANGGISVNIILSIRDNNSTSLLKLLLDAITELSSTQQISGINVKLFVILYDIENDHNPQDSIVKEELKSFEEIAAKYDPTIGDIYYLDDRNSSQVILKLDIDWLAFAIGEFLVFQMICETSGALMNKSKVFGLGVIHFNELLFRNVIANTILQYKFEEEGVLVEGGVQLRDLYKKCNPFIKEYQNFFSSFLNTYPFSQDNNNDLTSNSKKYIEDFRASLDEFITNEENKIGESKALLAHLLGEDDKKLEGIDWNGERLDINDLEFDVIDYFNKYLEEKDQVKFTEQKDLRNTITNLVQGIKKDEKKLKDTEEQSNEINRDLEISLEEGIFNVDGKRINASGYIPSPISPNDEIYAFSDEVIPTMVDLSPYFSTVKDQGQLSSCTSFTVTAVYEFFAKRNNKIVDISELFVYYNTRDIDGLANEKSGVTLLATIQAVKENGACYSQTYPYLIESYANKPPEEAYIEAQHQVVNKASRVNIKENDFKQAIANGHPVIIGLRIFESFYPKNKLGIIFYPSKNEMSHKNHGNHALLIVGYNDDEKLFKVRNSWGKEFGDYGYCYAPYDYITNPEFCLEAFVITDIADLSFNEFNYNNHASFSFLKDSAIRKKLIMEYNLREKKRQLIRVKKEYDELAYKNEENASKIKDPLFRKRLSDELKSKSDVIPIASTPSEIEKSNNRTPFFIIGTGVLIVIISGILLLFSVLSYPQALIGILIGIIIGVFGFFQIQKKKPLEVETLQNESSFRFDEKDMYAFEAADNLFDIFDEMRQSLIRRYKAISNYYSKVKTWQKESETILKQINYDSPDFVINVVKKKPLLDYLQNNKSKFLLNLPNLSNTFHKNYNPKTDNVNEVFRELKDNYLDDIYKNIETILDISIVDYIQGEREYPYFESPPPLDKTIGTIQKVSMPFCNLNQTINARQIQDYVILEEIIIKKDKKLNEFSKNRDASIKPIITFRKKNRKKYVAIQVAPLSSIKDLVRYDL